MDIDAVFQALRQLGSNTNMLTRANGKVRILPLMPLVESTRSYKLQVCATHNICVIDDLASLLPCCPHRICMGS